MPRALPCGVAGGVTSGVQTADQNPIAGAAPTHPLLAPSASIRIYNRQMRPHLASGSRPTGQLVHIHIHIHIHILKRERERKQDLPDLPVSAPETQPTTTSGNMPLVPRPSHVPCPIRPMPPFAHAPIFAISVLRGRQHGVAALRCVRIAPQSTLFVIAGLPACPLVHSPAVRP